MSFGARLTLYAVVILIGGLVNMYMQYRQSVIDYESDKSAMAAWGFLPFIFPVFFIWPAIIFGSIGAVAELVLLVLRLFR